jgi:hypothetical protein
VRRSPALSVVLVVVSSGLAWLTPPVTAAVERGPASAVESRPAGPSTVRFTSARRYVVTTKVGRKTVRGTGRLPDGVAARSASARPSRDVLGSRAPEVLVDYGRLGGEMPAQAYGVFTVTGSKLRPVKLGRYPLVLLTFTEGGDDAGFRCSRGALQVHWFHHGSGTGERTTYVLEGTRVVETTRTALTRPTASRPGSCG